MPHITSYDYDAPISEAGDYCQPGIGGDCKFWVRGRARGRVGGRSAVRVKPGDAATLFWLWALCALFFPLCMARPAERRTDRASGSLEALLQPASLLHL